MSNSLTVIDTDTRIGALKREAHWALVIAATGGGLAFTWLWHLMAWTPLGFAIHGVAGAAGGYLVGSGVARALTGVRARPWLRRYEAVTTGNRVVASGLRLVVGAAFFYASYLWAVGLNVSTSFVFDPALLGAVLPFAIWAFIIFVAVGQNALKAMR